MNDRIETLLEAAQALIFDCDGTLADSAPLYAQVIAEAFAHTGTRMPVDWYYARHGLSESVLMDDFEAAFDVRLDRPYASRFMREAYVKGIAQMKEIREVADIARRFHGLKPMAVASGGPAEIVMATLEHLNLHTLFDTVVTYEDVGRAKPDPGLFLEAARRLGIAPSLCLVFEDSPQGLKGAENAAMPVIDVAELCKPNN